MAGPNVSFCIQELRRLRHLAFFPDEPDLLRDLAAKLAQLGQSESHARRLVTAWLERSSKAPSIADLNELAETVPAFDSQTLPPQCARCRECNWVTRVQGGLECAERCSCARGQALREMDRLRMIA